VNTQTRLAVDMEQHARKISLEQGEAWFQVAKDPARPFIVAAGQVRVRAIGTAFAVQRLATGADVQVTEGTVEVWSVGNEANRKHVTAGARTFAADESGPYAVVEASLEIDRALSWREGNLQLDGDTLGNAAAQFNRYNVIKLDVTAELRDERVIGRFRTNEPEAFAQAAALMLGAKISQDGDTIRIARD
jgi:transmembrane sensor